MFKKKKQNHKSNYQWIGEDNTDIITLLYPPGPHNNKTILDLKIKIPYKLEPRIVNS